jgi:hypothetical protein
MTKIVKIRLENFKAIDLQEMNFNGASAIITGGNNKGKTSFLRGIPERIRFNRPQIKVRQGATEGYGEMTLDNGDRFVWEFDDVKKDKLTYITSEGTKASVTMDLGRQFFPPLFDIDKFLQSAPKDQVKQLQKIVGIDFTDVDKRYDEAYAIRKTRNEEAERYHVKLSKLMKCDPVTPVDVEMLNIERRQIKAKQEAERVKLNDLYLANKKANEEAIAAWEEAKGKIDREVGEHNKNIADQSIKLETCRKAYNVLSDNGYTGTEVSQWLGDFNRSIKPGKNPLDLYPPRPETPDPMPDRKSLDAIEKEIEAIDANILAVTETNVKAAKYKEYIDYIADVKEAKTQAEEAATAVMAIEDERKEMIAKAKFPQGISINSDGVITVDGFPLDRDQLSTSKLYTAALRIASMNLGEVRALHFDASFLDKNSLQEIHEWAVSQDLQLLIERPDYSGGEIEYQLIEG